LSPGSRAATNVPKASPVRERGEEDGARREEEERGFEDQSSFSTTKHRSRAATLARLLLLARGSWTRQRSFLLLLLRS